MDILPGENYRIIANNTSVLRNRKKKRIVVVHVLEKMHELAYREAGTERQGVLYRVKVIHDPSNHYKSDNTLLVPNFLFISHVIIDEKASNQDYVFLLNRSTN